MEGLRERRRVCIRREACQNLKVLRNTPEITFVLDQSIEYGVDDVKAQIEEVTRGMTTSEGEKDVGRIELIRPHGSRSAAISARTGDCVGSCMGLYQY